MGYASCLIFKLTKWAKSSEIIAKLLFKASLHHS